MTSQAALLSRLRVRSLLHFYHYSITKTHNGKASYSASSREAELKTGITLTYARLEVSKALILRNSLSLDGMLCSGKFNIFRRFEST